MPPCEICHANSASVRRSYSGTACCKDCFLQSVEQEVHSNIQRNSLIAPGDRIAVGVSGGKDSSVLLHILSLLLQRYPDCYAGVSLSLVAVNEGIEGYRDESLACVEAARDKYGLPLTVVSFKTRFRRDLDEIMRMSSSDIEDQTDQAQGVSGCMACSYCGVLRRNSLSYGCALAGCTKVATGHNGDDNAETVLLNLLRGDSGKLLRCTLPFVTLEGGHPRIKPLFFLAQRDIVLYAYLNRLQFFSTECPYAVAAFRGRARTLINRLSRRTEYRDVALRIIESIRHASSTKPALPAGVHICQECGSPLLGDRCQTCLIRDAETAADLRKAMKVKPPPYA